MKENILVVCIHNSARSQMAEEYFRKFADDLFDVESAGLEPGTLNPYVIAALKEDGIDISGKSTQSVFDLKEQGRTFTYVVTVCAKEAHEKCPLYPGTKERLHWPFDDPSGFDGTDDEKMKNTRRVREEIKEKISNFLEGYRNKK